MRKKETFLSKRETKLLIFLSVAFIGIEQILYAEIIARKQIVRADIVIQASAPPLMSSRSLLLIFHFVAFLYLYLLVYIYHLGRERRKNRKLYREVLENRLELQHYEWISSATEQLRIFRHDIRNHLETINRLAKEEEYAEIQNYIAKINHHFEQSAQIVSTGNMPVDCIMTMKLGKAAQLHIPVQYSLHIPDVLPCDDYELCSLLGNLLDNAIEGCEKTDADKRFIEIELMPYQNMFLIKISNSSNGEYLTGADNTLLSDKKKKPKTEVSFEHGLGLKRVTEIAEKYAGFMEITPGRDRFHAVVMLPLGIHES